MLIKYTAEQKNTRVERDESLFLFFGLIHLVLTPVDIYLVLFIKLENVVFKTRVGNDGHFRGYFAYFEHGIFFEFITVGQNIYLVSRFDNGLLNQRHLLIIV